MRKIRNSARGRHRIWPGLRRSALAAVVIGGLSGGLAGAAAVVAPVLPAQAAANMTLAQFVSTYNGHYLDYPAGHGGAQYQCVDLFKAYDVHVVGGTGPATGGNGGADAYWNNFTSSLATRYAKVSSSQPAQPGDVAVWGGGEDNLGHVAIVLSSAAASATSLSVLTQNPGPVQKATIGKTFTFAGYKATLLGYLRPKQSPTQPAPAPPPAATTTYHAGRQVTIDKHATGGVSGHKGPGNSYATGPTRPANSALWIVCYETGQSITGPYDTTTIWDLSDDGYFYTDAWIYTGTNGPAVPKCAPRTVTVDKHATGGVSGHKGPGNSYAAGPTRAVNTQVTIFCYVTGQSISGPYDTTTIWDLSNDGYYYTDAWLYTGTNGAAVPAC
jgi:CHAP domain-containing protein